MNRLREAWLTFLLSATMVGAVMVIGLAMLGGWLAAAGITAGFYMAWRLTVRWPLTCRLLFRRELNYLLRRGEIWATPWVLSTWRKTRREPCMRPGGGCHAGCECRR